MKCGLCNSEKLAEVYTKMGHTIVKCMNCNLMFVNKIIAKQSLANFYNAGYYKGTKGYFDYLSDKKNLVGNFSKYLKKLQRFKKNGKLLDVGCATGFFLELARNAGFDSYGIDCSDYAASYARTHLDLNVQSGEVFNIDKPSYFDIVTIWDCLEHTPNPFKVLTKIFELLKEGGLLVIETWDADSYFAKICGSRWHAFCPPEHLYFWSKETFKKILEKHNFKVLKIETKGKIIPLCTTLKSLGLKSPRLFGFFKKIRINNFPVYIRLGDNIVVYAIKKRNES